MSRLFIELYLDEDVDVLVADLLRAYGYTATTAHGAGTLGATDVEQLGFATAQGWTILTTGFTSSNLTKSISHPASSIPESSLPFAERRMRSCGDCS